MAVDTTSLVGKMGSVFELVGGANVGDRCSNRLGRAADQVLYGENDFGGRKLVVDSRQGPQVDHNGRHVLIRHIAVVLVRHNGKKGAAIVADAFAYSAGQLIISPTARPGLLIGGKVRRHDAPGQTSVGQNLSGSFFASHLWACP